MIIAPARVACVLALGLVACFSRPAAADTVAQYSTTLAVMQAIDAVQTQTGLHHSECVTFEYVDANVPKTTVVCHPPLFYEADPLAKPFVKDGYGPTLAAGLALNWGVSTFARHNKTVALLMRLGVFFYPLLLVHNAHDLHLQATYDYVVPVK